MDIALILSTNYRNDEWVLNGETYDGLEWLSDSPKPSEAELEKQWIAVEAQAANDAVSNLRLAGYREQSDPIFFQYQRGVKTEQEWLDAVAAVDAAYPYPV